MNQKKCPKCGEDNPAEAVMCWACYTPLSGAAGAGAAGGATGAAPGGIIGAPGGSTEKQKASIQPWQWGILGGAFLLAAVVGARALMGPTDTGAASTTGSTGSMSTGATGASAGGSPSGSGMPGGSSGGGGSSTSGETKVPDPLPLPYNMVLSPNPQSSRTTAAIVPKDLKLTAVQAAGLANHARRQFINSSRWAQLHIYVFVDPTSAKDFSDYQIKRRNEGLAESDYKNLMPVWNSALVRYEFAGGREKVLYPSQNPENWWKKG